VAGSSTMCVLLSSLDLGATVFVVQGQPVREELLSQLFTICTMEETIYMVGDFQDLKNQGLPPSPLFSCPGVCVDSVMIGVLHCLDLGVTQEVCGNVIWEALEWFQWGSRLRSARCANNVYRAAAALQGAEYTSSETVTVIDCYQSEWEHTQAQGNNDKQSKYIVSFFSATLATGLHAVHGSPHTRHARAVVTLFVNVIQRNVPHVGPKWSRQLAAKCVQLSLYDASGTFGGSNPNST